MSTVRFQYFSDDNVIDTNKASNTVATYSRDMASTYTSRNPPTTDGVTFVPLTVKRYTKEVTSSETIYLRVVYFTKPHHCLVFTGSDLSNKLVIDVSSSLSVSVSKDNKSVTPIEILGPTEVMNDICPAATLCDSDALLDPLSRGDPGLGVTTLNPTLGLSNYNPATKVCEYILLYGEQPDPNDSLRETAILLSVRGVLVRGYGWRLEDVDKSSLTIEELKSFEKKVSDLTAANTLSVSSMSLPIQQNKRMTRFLLDPSIRVNNLKLELESTTMSSAERERILFYTPVERTTMLFSKTIEVTRLVDVTADVINQEEKRLFNIKHSKMMYNRAMVLGSYGVLCLLDDTRVPELPVSLHGFLLKGVNANVVNVQHHQQHPLAPQWCQYPVIDLFSLLSHSSKESHNCSYFDLLSNSSSSNTNTTSNNESDVCLPKIIEEYVQYIERYCSVHHNRKEKLRIWKQAIEDNVIPVYFVDYSGRTILHWLIDWSDSFFVTRHDIKLTAVMKALITMLHYSIPSTSASDSTRDIMSIPGSMGLTANSTVIHSEYEIHHDEHNNTEPRGVTSEAFNQLRDTMLYCVEVGLSLLQSDTCGDSAKDIAHVKARNWERLSEVAAVQQSMIYTKDQRELNHVMRYLVFGSSEDHSYHHHINTIYNRTTTQFSAAFQILRETERQQKIYLYPGTVEMFECRTICPPLITPPVDVRGANIPIQMSSKLVAALRTQCTRNKQIPSLKNPICVSSRRGAVLYTSFSATNPNILFTLERVPSDYSDKGEYKSMFCFEYEGMKCGVDGCHNARQGCVPSLHDKVLNKPSYQYCVFLYDIYLDRTSLVYRFPYNYNYNDGWSTVNSDLSSSIYDKTPLCIAFYVLPFCASTHGSTSTDILLMGSGAWVGIDYTHKCPHFTVVKQPILFTSSRVLPAFSQSYTEGCDDSPIGDVSTSFYGRTVAVDGQTLDEHSDREIYIKKCVYESFDCGKIFIKEKSSNNVENNKSGEGKGSQRPHFQKEDRYEDGLPFRIMWLDRKKSDVHYVRHKAEERARKHKAEENDDIAGSLNTIGNELTETLRFGVPTEPLLQTVNREMVSLKDNINSFARKTHDNTHTEWKGRDTNIQDITEAHERFVKKFMLYPYSGMVSHMNEKSQYKSVGRRVSDESGEQWHQSTNKHLGLLYESSEKSGSGTHLLTSGKSFLESTATVLPTTTTADSLTLGVACFQQGRYLYCVSITESDLYSLNLPNESHRDCRDINHLLKVNEMCSSSITTLEGRIQRILNKITECCTHQDVQNYMKRPYLSYPPSSIPPRTSLSFTKLPREDKSNDENDYHPDLSVFKIPDMYTGAAGDAEGREDISDTRLVITAGGNSIYAAGPNGLLIEYNVYTREFITIVICADKIDSAGPPMCLAAVSEPVYRDHSNVEDSAINTTMNASFSSSSSFIELAVEGNVTHTTGGVTQTKDTSGVTQTTYTHDDVDIGCISTSALHHDTGCFWTPYHPFRWLVDSVFRELVSCIDPIPSLSVHQQFSPLWSVSGAQLLDSDTSLLISRRRIQLHSGTPDKAVMKHLAPDLHMKVITSYCQQPQGVKIMHRASHIKSTQQSRSVSAVEYTTNHSNDIKGPHPRATRIIWAGKDVYVRTLNSSVSRELLQEYNIPCDQGKPSTDEGSSSYVAISPADPDGLYITMGSVLYRCDLYRRAIHTLYHIPLPDIPAKETANCEKTDELDLVPNNISTGTDKIMFNIDGTKMLRYNTAHRSVSVYNPCGVIYTRAAHKSQ